MLGVVSILLDDMPSKATPEWYSIKGLRVSDQATGSIKLSLCAHVIPEIMVERPRRDFTAIKENRWDMADEPEALNLDKPQTPN